MTKNSVCLTLYLRNHTSYDCEFWYLCVKWWYLQQIFSCFKNFGLFWGDKRAKNDLKLPISVCFALYLRNCRSYHQDFDNDIYRCFSLSFFFFKYDIVNIKIIYFNSFCNNYLFSKFINKCQKEIMRCAHLLHMCVIFLSQITLTQMFNFPIHIPNCECHSPALLDFFLSSDASIFLQ